MHPEPLYRLIRTLRRGVSAPEGQPVGDAELLRRFADGRDEAAFELLLWRHGPMVLAVCRRLLRHAEDAEDAFQATFLALARKAGAIARGEAVGGWLYRVAYRVALRARAARERRARREQSGVEVGAAPAADPAWGDFREVVDEEVNRLPARQRTAFILCCLEGRTGAEAARQLGCSPGTVSSRLTRARQLLRSRLARRGLAPSAGALAAALAGEAPAAPVPTQLVHSTLKGSLLFAAGKTAAGVLSGRAVPLAEGVLRAMFLTRLRVAAVLLLLAGLLVAGGVLTRQALDAAPPAEAQGAGASAKPHDGPAVVRVVKPQQGGLERLSTLPGRVQAFEKVDLAAAVSGWLKDVSVDIGDRVKKGQLLAEIGAPLLELDVKQATAAVQQAKGAVREAEARVATARAGVEAAESGVARVEAELAAARDTVSFRQQQLKRVKDLFETKSIDRSALDEKESETAAAQGQVAAATAAVKAARTAVDVQKSNVAQAEAGLKSAAANLEAAEVALEKAQYTRGLTRIVSPVDGVVSRRNAADGQYVQPGGPGAAEPLLTVERIDRVRVVTEVPERDVPLTRPGVPVTLSLSALPDVRFRDLKVTRVGFVEDPKTSTMRVEIDVPNPQDQLRPGMYAQATLDLGPGPRDAFRLPSSAVFTPPASPGWAVYVVRGGTAHLTPVHVNRRQGDETEIDSGLKPDDLVVADPRRLKGDVVPVQVADDKPPK
jgi:RND family efflux transporter MFP subunit